MENSGFLSFFPETITIFIPFGKQEIYKWNLWAMGFDLHQVIHEDMVNIIKVKKKTPVDSKTLIPQL
jgi:hypothetical protein